MCLMRSVTLYATPHGRRENAQRNVHVETDKRKGDEFGSILHGSVSVACELSQSP